MTAIVACAALVNEVRAVLAADGLDAVVPVTYLPAPLHNRPERIPEAVRTAVEAVADIHDTVLVGYADCGTGGLLDAEIARLGTEHEVHITRLPGAHCYEFLAGAEGFAELADAEPGTFYLTDFLARHFDALVWSGLGLDRHRELRDLYFANYRRVVLLTQSDDPDVHTAARAAASMLALPLEVAATGREPLTAAVRVGLRGPLPAISGSEPSLKES